MSSVNAIIGDDNFGLDIPTTQVQADELMEEKKAAKFSRTAEYKKLKEHLEERIEFYQLFLPNGREIDLAQPSAEDWRVANAVIGEFKAIINAYETAQSAVQDASGRTDS